MKPIQTDVLPNGIVSLKLTGDLTNAYAVDIQASLNEAAQGIEQLFTMTKSKLLVLLDLSDFTGVYDQEVMAKFSEFAKMTRDKIKWVSAFGGNDKANLAASAVVILDGHDNMDTYPTREEAMAALEKMMTMEA
jgi:hypothetical protein